MNSEQINEMKKFCLSEIDLLIAHLKACIEWNERITNLTNQKYEDMINEKQFYKTKLRYWLGNIIKLIITYLGFGHAVSFDTYKNYVDDRRIYTRVNAVNVRMRELNHDLNTLLDSCYQAKDLMVSSDEVVYNFYTSLVNADLSYINTYWLFNNAFIRCGIQVGELINQYALDPSTKCMDPSGDSPDFHMPMYCKQIKQKLEEEVNRIH